jgi:LCP family protein required for cell wall assembly
MVSRPPCRSRDGKGQEPPARLAMWNEAFALGGEACTIAQFEMMSHLRVNHFVIVDFNGFKSMVDALGGVPVCLPKEVNDTVGKIHLPAGSYEVTGDQALDYVRARHAISASGDDISRIKRQQAFLAAMVHKAVSAKTLFNPGRLIKFLDAATQSLTMDPGLAKLTDLFRLAQELRGIGLDKVQFLTVPIATYTPDPNRIAVGPGTDKLWGELRRDEVLDREFTSGATNASEGKPGSGRPEPGDAAEAAANGLCA